MVEAYVDELWIPARVVGGGGYKEASQLVNMSDLRGVQLESDKRLIPSVSFSTGTKYSLTNNIWKRNSTPWSSLAASAGTNCPYRSNSSHLQLVNETTTLNDPEGSNSHHSLLVSQIKV